MDRPSSPRDLRVSTFAGASSIPLFAGVDHGIFARAGLEVELVQIRSSDEMRDGLLDGGFQVVHAATDNFITWRDATAAPIVAWMGGTSGPVSLVGQPDIESVAALRGQRIAVDAVASGFVSVLRKILREAGLDTGDLTLDPVGATQLRYRALLKKRVAATMLTLPFSAMAVDVGLRVLADQRSVLPRLQGSSGASLVGWLATNPDVADTYLRAVIAAVTWCYLPENAAALRALIVERYEVDERLAETVRAALFDPVAAWPPSAFLDPEGVAVVHALRTENGMPPASPPEAYYDLGPYRRVMGFGLLDPAAA